MRTQKCDLCPKKDGAFKRTDSGGKHQHIFLITCYHIIYCIGWAHVVCALYIPEASFGNNTTMEPIVVSKIPKDRFTKVVYVYRIFVYVGSVIRKDQFCNFDDL